MILKQTNLNIRASQAEKAMLEQVAKANETTPSEMMRQLIRQAHAKLQENIMKHLGNNGQSLPVYESDVPGVVIAAIRSVDGTYVTQALDQDNNILAELRGTRRHAEVNEILKKKQAIRL